MAKWGEGDPRWIVEERPDATNVNNWHWTEKNACQWSQDTLKKLLVGLEIKGDHFRCTITSLEKCQGEAVVNNRKGKLIFLYEWDIIATFQGAVRGKEGDIEGKITIPNLSEENEINEVDVSFSLKTTYDDSAMIKEFLKNIGSEIVREQLRLYLKQLKEEFSKGLILPKKNDNTKNQDQIENITSNFNKNVAVNNLPKNTTSADSSSVSTKVRTKDLTVNHSFHCTGAELYNALTQIELVTAFTQGPAKLELKAGGIFELFGGNIHGTFIELVQDKKIVQKWRSKRWPVNHFSTVTISMDQQEDNTVLNLVQTGIPESDYEGTKDNWNRYYWDAIRRTLGYGSSIFAF